MTTRSFGEKEFVSSLWKTMKKQQRENPSLKHLYSRLSPEFVEVTHLIQNLLESPKDSEEKIVEEIKRYGEAAILPLIDFLRHLKERPDPSSGP